MADTPKIATAASLRANAEQIAAIFDTLQRQLDVCRTAGSRRREQTIDEAQNTMRTVEAAIASLFQELIRNFEAQEAE